MLQYTVVNCGRVLCIEGTNQVQTEYAKGLTPSPARMSATLSSLVSTLSFSTTYNTVISETCHICHNYTNAYSHRTTLDSVVAGQIASLGVFAAIRPSALYSHYHAATSTLG